MCIICVELIKQNMTYLEAENASKEMTLSSTNKDLKHFEELNRSLREADLDTLDKLLEEGWDEKKRST